MYSWMRQTVFWKRGGCGDRIRESMKNRLEKGYLLAGQTDLLCGWKKVVYRLNRKNCVSVCTMEQQKADWEINGQYRTVTKSVNSYNNSFELLVKDLKYWKKNGYQVLLLSGSRTRAQRLAQDLQEQELNSFYTEDMDRTISPGEIMTAYGHAKRGFEYPLIKFVLITETDIFGQEKKSAGRRLSTAERRSRAFPN